MVSYPQNTHRLALFPDRKDYQVLKPLPLRLRTLFLAKIASFATLLGVSSWTSTSSASSFGWASTRGLSCSCRGRSRQRVVHGAVIMNLVLIPLLGLMLPKLVMVDHTTLSFLPGFWFTCLYEQLLTSSKHPVLLRSSDTALWALAGAAGLFLVTYLPDYMRQARKSIEEPTPSPKGPGWLSRHTAGLATKALLRNPIERAIFHFIGATITRSAQRTASFLPFTEVSARRWP